MARIVEFHSSEQPHISMSESLNYRLAEPLVYRDLDGVLADIPAACCRRCGEVTLRSDTVANHLCTTQERTDRLVERGMEAFHAVVSRNDQLAAAQERIAALEAALITLVCHDCGDMFTETVGALLANDAVAPLAPMLCAGCGDEHRAALAGSHDGEQPQAAVCTEGHHVVAPGADGCGENRRERMMWDELWRILLAEPDDA